LKRLKEKTFVKIPEREDRTKIIAWYELLPEQRPN
jgi:hypothetical protein